MELNFNVIKHINNGYQCLLLFTRFVLDIKHQFNSEKFIVVRILKDM